MRPVDIGAFFQQETCQIYVLDSHRRVQGSDLHVVAGSQVYVGALPYEKVSGFFLTEINREGEGREAVGGEAIEQLRGSG